jgi:hypothetical protein
MDTAELKLYRSEIGFIAICSICLQMPDLKVGSIKIAELLMLLAMPFYLKYVFRSRILLLFIGFYFLLLLKTFFFNIFTNFYINDALPALKQPYLITVSRLIEMVACAVFAVFVFKGLKASQSPLTLLKTTLFIQVFVFGILYCFVYSLYVVHLRQTVAYDNLIVYDTSEGDMVYRLKGFYVEGGPLGLFYAFVFTLCVAFYKRLNLKPLYLVIPLVIVLLAGSKAGYMLVLLCIAWFLFKWINSYFKNVVAKVSFYVVIVATMIGAATFVLQMYISDLTDVDKLSSNFSPTEIDPNYMMGRISATVIVPNMVKAKYLEGIGWGNYPLLRNNPAYRGLMPEIQVSLWDATGFGGMADTFIEAGLLLFILYLLLYAYVIGKMKRSINQPGFLILAFIGPLILGVAIYFMYTWFLLGIILFSFQNDSPLNGHREAGQAVLE